MIVTFFWNSFIHIKAGKSSIVCDPWINEVFPGCGWFPTKEYNKKALLRLLSNADYIYLSHIHYDHFDTELLAEVEEISEMPLFLIPKLKNNYLYNKLSNLISKKDRIIELSPFEPNKSISNDFQLFLVPQMTESSSEIPGIGYDMDSSLIIKDTETEMVFMNSVDNPLSSSDYAKINDKMPYKTIDLATFTGASACQYPQSFMCIDRAAIRDNIQSNCYASTLQNIKSLAPRNFVFCGGSYSITPKLKSLEKYKVLLTPRDGEKLSLQVSSRFLDIERFQSIKLSNGNCESICLPIYSEVVNEPANSLRAADMTVDPLVFDENNGNIDISSLLKDANINFLRQVKRFDMLATVSNLSIEFFGYASIPDLVDNHNFLEVKSEPIYIYKLEGLSAFEIPQKSYEYHIPINVLIACIKGEASWNTVLTSSVCIVKRLPNVYSPSEEQIINFFKI